MVEKIVVVIMGQNCEKFIGMCMESVKDADAIVYCDGGSSVIDGFWWKIKQNKDIVMIENKYNQEDKKMNGIQRNFYLNYLKKNYDGWFCLCLDADEIVEDLSKIKQFINILPKQNDDMLFSLKMRHFIGSLGWEDATQPIHFVPHRLFKIRKDLVYDEVEHPILHLKNKEKERSVNIQPTILWHLSYIPGMWDIKKKYENHLKKSNIHTEEFLDDWKDLHMLGLYPQKQIDIQEIPDIILREFNVSKEKWYFRNRGLETKHFIDVYNYKKYFKLDKENGT